MVDVTAQARKHATDIRLFRRKLFSDDADSTAFVRSGDFDDMPSLRRLGPLKSVTNRHAELTIVGDVVDQAAVLEDPTREGMMLTLSVAAHHRLLDSRLLVDADEAAEWISTILGAWAGHVYAAGALSTTSAAESAPRLTTLYFYVFIAPDGRPQEAPETFSVPLQSIRQSA